jgi:hypothetical protein
MSSNAPEPNDGNTLFVDLAEDTEGRRTFTPRLPAPAGLDWNVNHRRLDVLEKGDYFLTIVAGNGLTFATPAIVFTTPATGISFQGQSGNAATIAITSDYGEERAVFDIVLQTDSGGIEIVDPTILVEPPGGIDSEAPSVPSLVVNVSLTEAGDYLYEPDQADTPNLVWVEEKQTAKISAVGTFRVIFNAAFPLGPLGILFPNGGKPGNVTRSKDADVVTLEIAASQYQKILLQIQQADNNLVPNEPTILVEPPGQVD